MEFSLKHWRDEEEEQEKAAAMKLQRLLNSHHHHQSPASPALPLFTPEPEPTNNLSAPYSSDNSTPTPAAKLPPRMESCFSLNQWQELELQAMMFRHMMAGATVPPELLHLLKKSLVTSSPYYLCNPLHQHYHHYQPAWLPSGYWGRAAMDTEPGRCRRTDGKKWRCSRDVVTGQKYCERHMHRGRNRSRKHVEISTSTKYGRGAGGGGGGDAFLKNIHSTVQGVPSTTVTGGGPYFGLSAPVTSVDVLNRSSSEKMIGFQAENGDQIDGGGRTLRRFFDDWPRSEDNAGSSAASATNLSMSIPGNPSSDFSLKLGTGNGEESRVEATSGEKGNTRQLNWCTAWETTIRAVPMGGGGGPLAEALRSSTSSTSSPTSVLRRLPRSSASETSS